MNKYGNIAIAFVISSFLAINIYLLFGEKSKIEKLVYVSEYERMTIDDFSVNIPKEALVSPMEVTTVYAGSEDDVESWLITEGDHVNVGDELALLNTEHADGEQALLEVESSALLQQENEVRALIADLSAAQSLAQTDSTSTVDRNDNVTEIDGETTIALDLTVGFTVDVTQEGSYAQALAAAEQQLTDITQKITVIEARLTQDPARPALVSPVEGVISKVSRMGSKLAVDIYSSEKVIVTYAVDDEWLLIEEGATVLLQGSGFDEATEGVVLSVSVLPAKDNDAVEAFKVIDPKKAKNPLAYYEVQISTENDLQTVPYGNNINAHVITNEAKGAVSLNEKWLRGFEEGTAKGMMINHSGKAVEVLLETPFTQDTRAVVTNGLSLGQIAMYAPKVRDFEDAPKVFLPMPSYMPTKDEWKSFGWENYLDYMIVK